MPDADDAAKKAQRDEIKGLFKEALTEWQAEEMTKRTQEEDNRKRSGGLFGALSDLFGA